MLVFFKINFRRCKQYYITKNIIIFRISHPSDIVVPPENQKNSCIKKLKLKICSNSTYFCESQRVRIINYLLNTSKKALNVINTGYISNLPVSILNMPAIFNGQSKDCDIWPISKPMLPCIEMVKNNESKVS